MNTQKTLVFIGAHPDDETFGPGATLAHYAASGVKVYYVCATRGEAGTVARSYLKNFASVADLRASEMSCAARALGLAGVTYLGYRDSGMTGSPDNQHPDALIRAPLDQVAGRVVEVLRALKPDVVVTHDAGGGYGHPDHIAVHNAVVQAFESAGDAERYPGAGRPFQPSKLYFTVRPLGTLKFMVRLMPLFGQDPHRFGRNRDIDLTLMIGRQYPVNAVIRLSKRDIQMRNAASACHASQGGGRSRAFVFRASALLEKLRGPRDYFMRANPPPGSRLETDLFQGLSG